MYTSILCAVGVIATYFCAKAILSNFVTWGIFDTKGMICLITGAILGIFTSAPLFAVSSTMGAVGMGIGISIVYIFAYSGFTPWILSKVPASAKKVVKIIIKILKVILVIAAIILAVVGFSKFFGI